MMRDYTFSEEVVLIAEVDGSSAAGDTVALETRTVSFAEIVSPFSKETYEGLAVGLKPEFRVILPSWDDDYHGERKLEYNGVRYNIVRAYKANDLTCELTVTRLKAKVSDSDTLASAGFMGGV